MHLCCAVHGKAQPPSGRPVLGAVHAQLALFALLAIVHGVKQWFWKLPAIPIGRSVHTLAVKCHIRQLYLDCMLELCFEVVRNVIAVSNVSDAGQGHTGGEGFSKAWQPAQSHC